MIYKKIKDIKPNPENPRVIRDKDFDRLVASIKEFPEMLEARPIVVDDNNVILGGNMRFRACQEAGFKEVPVIVRTWDQSKDKEFIIKDNVSGGEWDWEVLANEWDQDQLADWGVDIWKSQDTVQLDDFFSQEDQQGKDNGSTKIVLEYPEVEAIKVKEALLKVGETPEEAVYKLLGL